MKNNLLDKKCVPCEGGVPPLTHEEILNFMGQVEGWNLIEEGGENVKKFGLGAKISKEYKFADFIGAINFVNKIAEIAEEEGHHPDIKINYNKVSLELSTHAISGLSENDFILAAKIDASK
ncbi:MAG: 4a-hydroxytetrahydrobiopterin dehydratase [Candidatus Pacebacteria bacterium]|nr:4a-hydroxytetrahydrobiopterin dehydratase [Candidatus Paceibacterota bacterium]